MEKSITETIKTNLHNGDFNVVPCLGLDLDDEIEKEIVTEETDKVLLVC